jgi:hypothetical protein
MKRFFVAFLLALSCVYAQAQSQDCVSMMRRALEVTDFNQSIDDAVEQLNSESFLQQVSGGGSTDATFMKIFLPIMQKHFNAQALKKDLEDRMIAHCNPQQMELTLQHLQSPVVVQMMRLDAEARTPEGKQKLQRYMRAIKVAPPSDTRMSQIQAFDERVGVTAFALDAMIATTRGLMTGMGAPAEVLSELDSIRATYKFQIQSTMLLALSSAYRSVGAADLDAFAKELTSQPLKGFYDQARKAFVVMIESRCTEIGKDMKAAMEANQKQGGL